MRFQRYFKGLAEP